MKINEIIKEKRKEQELTQEQMAQSLGVTAPAVNKWEKGVSYPDITLLPPLARLLHVDLNTLLSFQEELTDKEIGNFTEELSNLMKQEGFHPAYEKAMAKIKEYPNCDKLLCMTALTLDGGLMMFPPENREAYEKEIKKLYQRVSRSDDVEISSQAKYMLISEYRRQEQYQEAQKLLDSIPQRPMQDKKQIQAHLYVDQGELDKAAELWETRLLDAANGIYSILLGLLDVALRQGEQEQAEYLVQISKKAARLFGLWEYVAHSAEFQLASSRKDQENVIQTLKKMLDSLEKGWNLDDSLLYRHVKRKDGMTAADMIPGVINALKEDKEFDFMRENKEFLSIIQRYGA